VAVARKGLSDKAAEAGTGAGDKDYLFGIQGGASMKAYIARLYVGSKVIGIRRRRGGLNAEGGEKNPELKALHREWDGCSVLTTGETAQNFDE
jgi:hypothetical protein